MLIQKKAIKRIGRLNNRQKGYIQSVSPEKQRGLPKLPHVKASEHGNKRAAKRVSHLQQNQTSSTKSNKNASKSPSKRRKNKLYAHVSSTGYGNMGKRTTAASKTKSHSNAKSNATSVTKSKDDHKKRNHNKSNAQSILSERRAAFR